MKNKSLFKKSKPVVRALLVAVTAFTLTACQGSDTTTLDENTTTNTTETTKKATTTSEYPVPADAPWKSAKKEQITIRSGFAKGMTGLANQFAIQNGWYEDAKITLDQLDIPNPVSAFGSGEVDIADGDPGTYIPGIDNGIPIKIVGNMWRNRGAYWIIANDDIQSFEDLKGKKIGSAGPIGGMKLTLMEVLSQNGIDPNKEVELVANGMYQTAYATFTSGEVDATIIHQPFATIAEEEGTGHTLAKTWEFIPDYHTGVLVAANDVIENRPEDLERVLEVYYYANQYVKTHLDEVLPWLATYLNISEETAKKAIESEIVLWENNPVVDVNRLQITEDLLTEYGMQKETINVDGVVNNTAAEMIAKKLKLGSFADTDSAATAK